ncbi:hypothetical protein [uncultured Salegentibacter sp.]|uniref:hypothetical protein n=1 Tax=uncultured Salegentibacter sp. TaxID=259320 RepID=UPI00259223A5|nr:hypothetical protein [uncultured Salegentibacter sp.]
MKILNPFILILLIFCASCDKNDDQPQNPIDQLPPATQTGEQTFGCLIDGVPFIPDNFGFGRPSAFYQFSNDTYTLNISASNRNEGYLKSISIGAIKIENEIGERLYDLVEEEENKFYGQYNIGGGTIYSGISSGENSGKLEVTNFDPDNFILSGTFEFTVLDEKGSEIEITDGRFDIKYTN